MKGNRTLSIGVSLFGLLALFCMIGSMLLPMDPYVQTTRLKNLPPSSAYLAVPRNVQAGNVTTIVSGLTFSVALQADGTLITWGSTDFELPDAIHDVKEVAAGDRHLLILYENGRIQQFGSNTEEMELSDSALLEHVFAYGDRSAGLSKDGIFYSNDTDLNERIERSGLQGRIRDVAMNDHQVGVVLQDDTVSFFGAGESEISTPPERLTDIVDLVFSDHSALAIQTDGHVISWGEMPLSADTNMHDGKAIAASAEACFLLHENGEITGAGTNTFGELDIPQGRYEHIFADVYQIYGIGDDVIAWGNHGFLLGSDAYGRDLLTRIVHGGRLTMGIGLIAVFFETILAILLGCICGYAGGLVDHLLMRVAEIFSCIPFLPLIVTLSAFLKDILPEQERIVLVMMLYGILCSPVLARMIRSAVLTERQKEYVISTRLMGAGTWHILRHELMPAIMHLVLVNVTLSYADSMLLESALSFLGFGVAPPYPTWGNLLEHAQSTFVLEHCPWQWMLPAICILLCVFAVHQIGEGLRKLLEPKER